MGGSCRCPARQAQRTCHGAAPHAQCGPVMDLSDTELSEKPATHMRLCAELLPSLRTDECFPCGCSDASSV